MLLANKENFWFHPVKNWGPSRKYNLSRTRWSRSGRASKSICGEEKSRILGLGHYHHVCGVAVGKRNRMRHLFFYYGNDEFFFLPPVTVLNYHGTINLNRRQSFRAGWAPEPGSGMVRVDKDNL